MLLMVLVLSAATMVILSGNLYRCSTVAQINQKNNDYNTLDNAAEAATEKVYAIMARDFSAYGPGQVSNNLAMYGTNYPNQNDNSYWTNFIFSNLQGTNNATSVQFLTNYTGNLPPNTLIRMPPFRPFTGLIPK